MNNERKRKNEEHLANLIAESTYEDFYDLKSAEHINCYAASMGFTYPDPYHQFYSPGIIHKLKVGVGPFVTNEYDPSFVDTCLQLDNIALNRKCERVNFQDINDDDMKYYIAITNFTSLHKSDHHLHFIFRTPNNLWLHKPNWIDPIQLINWGEYGKTFHFNSSCALTDAQIPCEGNCFPEFFYAMELPE